MLGLHQTLRTATDPMNLVRTLTCAIALFLAASAVAAAGDLPEAKTLRAWVEEMKSSERGPFAHIRWFCKDGTVLPPKAYACKPHGGGVQHGEWTDRVKLMRANGYSIANILAALDIEAFLSRPDYKDIFNQILIEQFLISADDGWIMRKARHYRGALQDEDERAAGRRLLVGLAGAKGWIDRRFLPLRIGARLIRHGTETSSIVEIRQVSAALSNKDPGFKTLRNKIHGQPDAGDAETVRAYAEKVQDPALRGQYEGLAQSIDAVYTAAPVAEQLADLAAKEKGLGALGEILQRGATRLKGADGAPARFAETAKLLAEIRGGIAEVKAPEARLALLDVSLALDDEHFIAATAMRDLVKKASRRQLLSWLEESTEAIYGVGLISARQKSALEKVFADLPKSKVDLKTYKTTLEYLALVPGWGGQRLDYYFQDSIQRFSAIEPLAELFTQDQLRGSPLFFPSRVLDSLLRDANRLAGVRNELFGENVGAGLRALNPGLARGRLHLAGQEHQDFQPDGIYLLPETIAELPPVAGILTAGEGNPLSHVQLLARNLGIPNVAVDETVIRKLKPGEGKTVILAVSQGGSVRLSEDTGQWKEIGGEQEQEGLLIRPDLDKLDLDVREFIPLETLRAEDSGRVVGPKAAKLGELRQHYPKAVARGLAIPFGSFRHLLDQTYADTGRSVFEWIVEQYDALEALPAGSSQRAEATEAFRRKLHEWIESADPGTEFRTRLRDAMEKTFGKDGTYGVFVRSDTNVEDLPGFTGAGLNLTVPNVVGFDRLTRAMNDVWASPFTARAFGWRQSHMADPEHVYPAVLLLLSVPADKSGVLVTHEISTGEPGWLSVAVNEGVGGAVDGQAAESLRINMKTGEVRLLAQATAPTRSRINPLGGLDRVPVSGSDRVLEPAEIEALIDFAKGLPKRFPAIVDSKGNPAPADVEFGFLDGKLQLFQIRPFLDSDKARGSAYLQSLDSGMRDLASVNVNLEQAPGE